MDPGEQLFLGAAKTLQHTLLPHLSAVDLFRLSTTSKNMQAWLHSTPPHLWQVLKLKPVLAVSIWGLHHSTDKPSSDRCWCRTRLAMLQQHTWPACRPPSSS